MVLSTAAITVMPFISRIIIVVNLMLIRRYLFDLFYLILLHLESLFLPNYVEMDNWNPMAEDFLSHRNSYMVDVDDPGVAAVSYS